MALNATDKNVARIVFSDDLEMRIETVTIHLHMEAAPLTLWTNLYLSAFDSRSHGKNCVVRDQSFSFLIFLFSWSYTSESGDARSPAVLALRHAVFGL
jgi:hypothetical protein